MASIEKRVRNGKVRWYVRYRTPEGQQRTKTFDRQVDAKNYATETDSSILVGDFVDPRLAKMTVGEWADKWFGNKNGLAETTLSRYEDILRKHIRPRWGKVALSRIRHEDVQQWLNNLPLSPASVRKVHRVLSMMLDYAVKARRLSNNPAKGVELPRVKGKPKRFLTHEQVDTLAKEVGNDWRLVVLFLAYTGLRWGELAALRVRNLDLLRRRAIIEQSYSPVKGRMTLSDTKGHERREVPIPKFLIPDLYAQLDGKRTDDLVFTGPKGAILRSQTLRQVVFPRASVVLGLATEKLDAEGNRITDKNGEPAMTGNLTPHELRHTAASLAIASGADVKVVQQMLGHKSATMTLDLYGHLFPDRLDVVADAMDAARTAALASR
jgi:integrase